MTKENKMGTMPIGRLLLSMSLPMMASMLVQALYNIVDSIFVAQISEEALTAVSLAFPAQAFMIAVCTGTGVGMNAILAKSLGERNFDLADRIAGNGYFLAAASYALFLALGLFAVPAFYTYQTGIESIASGGISYLRIVLILSFGITFEICSARQLQATGRAAMSMMTQLTGAILNIALDPILIFGWFGAPALGITGAALATVIAQIVACAFALWLNVRFNRDLRLRAANMRPELALIRRIYSVGLPSIVMASLGSILVFGLNKILMGYSATAAAVLGVYFKLQSFAFMPIFGLNNGMVPIIAYNFGAARPDRMIRTIKLGMAAATVVMIAAAASAWIFTREMFAMFSASQTMLDIGIPALRTIAIHFPLAGFCICTITTSQALGHGMMSLCISFVRQILVLLPSAYLLARAFGLAAIWWAFPVAEVASALTCAYFMRKMYISHMRPMIEPA